MGDLSSYVGFSEIRSIVMWEEQIEQILRAQISSVYFKEICLKKKYSWRTHKIFGKVLNLVPSKQLIWVIESCKWSSKVKWQNVLADNKLIANNSTRELTPKLAKICQSYFNRSFAVKLRYPNVFLDVKFEIREHESLRNQ